MGESRLESNKEELVIIGYESKGDRSDNDNS